jgi:ABC-type oligopeptide transport system substrate-binding subunit
LDRARSEQAYLKRIELYREAERLIMQDSPVIPLSYYSYEQLFQGALIEGPAIVGLFGPYTKIIIINSD